MPHHTPLWAGGTPLGPQTLPLACAEVSCQPGQAGTTPVPQPGTHDRASPTGTNTSTASTAGLQFPPPKAEGRRQLPLTPVSPGTPTSDPVPTTLHQTPRRAEEPVLRRSPDGSGRALGPHRGRDTEPWEAVSV